MGEGPCFLDCSGHSQQPELRLQLLVVLGSHGSLILHVSIFVFSFLKMLKQMLVHLAIAPNSLYRGCGQHALPPPTLLPQTVVGLYQLSSIRSPRDLESDAIDAGSLKEKLPRGLVPTWFGPKPFFFGSVTDCDPASSQQRACVFLRGPHAWRSS